ncbi:DAK2 domain-containing protein [Varibaculum vaginae]|uniref:DAK2 domain-containing protein n=1 Tax=Varibaculum vaginae TaxID=2364797 RepID=UPI000F0883A9|nr:DAK2 domain-containing protein [Varibaculum vaginae]
MSEEEPLADLFSFADFARAARAKKTVPASSMPLNNQGKEEKNPFEVKESEKPNKSASRLRSRQEAAKNSQKSGEVTVKGTTGLLDFEVPQLAPKPVKPRVKGKRENVATALESEERLDLQVTGSDIRHWVKVSGEVLQAAQSALDAMDSQSELDSDTGANALLTWDKVTLTVAGLPPSADRDVSWVLEAIADAALAGASGMIGIVLSELFSAAANAVNSPGLNPVQLLKVLRSSGQCPTRCLLPAVERLDPPTLSGLIEEVNAELETQPEQMSIEDILSRAWMASQVALVEGAEENHGRPDARAAVLMLLVAAMLETYCQENQQDQGALATSLQMVRDMTPASHLALPTSSQIHSLVLTWRGEVDNSRFQRLRAELEQNGVYGAITGRADMLGIGPRMLLVRTRHPRRVIELLPEKSGMILTRPPLLTENASSSSSNLVSLDSSRAIRPIRPAVLAYASAPGLVGDLANLGATVVLSRRGTPREILPLITEMEQEVVQVLPCDQVSAAELANLVRPAKDQGIEIMVAPTQDDLQVLEVARACCQIVSSAIEIPDLIQLQRSRTFDALAIQRTWTVSLETPFDLLTSSVSPNDIQARILSRKGEDPEVIARIQNALSQGAPGIRIELISGGQNSETLVGVLSS